jgi:hypothetical protein
MLSSLSDIWCSLPLGATMEPSLPTELDQQNIEPSPASQTAGARFCLFGASALLIAGLASVSFAGIKKVPYPEIKVTIDAAYHPDAAFEKMQAAFVDAVAKKDVPALSALVAPTFLWTIGGRPSDELDLGRDAIHNFKVVFGFRAPGEDADGVVGDGPYWDALAALAGDPSYYAATDSGNLVCGPIAADVADNDLFEQARKTIETGDEGADWYFTVANTDVMKAPRDTGAPIGKVGTVALPILGFYPSPQEGKPVSQFTHVEVLLPSGKSGWIPAAAVRPLFTDHLCYAKTPSGDWKIAAIDQPEH